MANTNFQELLDAGVHFGHLKRKWNPHMAPYIFMERNGIHIIDLHKTIVKLDDAAAALKHIAKSGRKILFVATKKQAKEIVTEKVKEIGMPYVTERWPGGMLTNFPTIRKAVKKMTSIDKMATDGTFDNMSKRERLQVTRQRMKLEKQLGSIADLTRLPAAMFVVDISKEYIAVREANRLNIPVFAMVDTNSDPNKVDFPIPANDDASKSISLIIGEVCRAVKEGLDERKLEKEKEAVDSKASSEDEDYDVAETDESPKRVQKDIKTKAKKESEPAAKTVAKKEPAKKASAKKEVEIEGKNEEKKEEKQEKKEEETSKQNENKN
jgi:small subunit ribosomal protein S2